MCGRVSNVSVWCGVCVVCCVCGLWRVCVCELIGACGDWWLDLVRGALRVVMICRFRVGGDMIRRFA